MNDTFKHIGRMWFKTALPIGGKTIADAVLPLGQKSTFDKMITGYNPNKAYDTTSGDQVYEDRMKYTEKKEKIEAPWEDAISGGIQSAKLLIAGGMTGNPMLLNAGMSKVGSTIAGLGRTKEKSELENAAELASTALIMLGSNNTNKSNTGKIEGNVDTRKVGKTEDTTSMFNIPNIKETLGVGGIDRILDDIKKQNESYLNKK